MVRVSTLLTSASLVGLALAAPLRLKRQAGFVELPYEQFQISDNPAGNCEALSNAVFVDPFAGVDLATVSDATLDSANTMARAAVDLEESFNEAIAASTDAAETEALQRGKIQNKCLKLVGQIQVLLIKQAQGQDVTAKLGEQQTKLAKNAADDAANAGADSISFLSVGGEAAAGAGSDTAVEDISAASASGAGEDASAGSADGAAIVQDIAAVEPTSDTASVSATDAAAGPVTTSVAKDATPSGDASTTDFVELPYEEFQISDGIAGDCEGLANAVFADKFAGVDLATVSEETRQAVARMGSEANARESDFNTAIAAATDATTADALERGKTLNKCLKLSGAVQSLLIKQAKGEDVTAKLEEEQKKLDNNIAKDAAEAGLEAVSFLSV